jgi:hypothetical protein
MDVRADSDGVVRAVFRNPDGYLGNAKFTLAAQGAHFKLLSINNGTTLLEGDYDEKHDRLLLPHPELRTTLELTRQTRDQATGYYLRTPSRALRLSPAPGRGQVAHRDARGDGPGRARISALVQRSSTPTRFRRRPADQGLLAARHGKLVLEGISTASTREAPRPALGGQDVRVGAGRHRDDRGASSALGRRSIRSFRPRPS